MVELMNTLLGGPSTAGTAIFCAVISATGGMIGGLIVQWSVSVRNAQQHKKNARCEAEQNKGELIRILKDLQGTKNRPSEYERDAAGNPFIDAPNVSGDAIHLYQTGFAWHLNKSPVEHREILRDYTLACVGMGQSIASIILRRSTGSRSTISPGTAWGRRMTSGTLCAGNSKQQPGRY